MFPMGKRIDHKKIEKKWQKKWEKEKIFQADIDNEKEKFFITIPYPYLNGGPHIGAGFTFMRGDTYARFKRMQGFNVLFPQGFHATGEPIVGAVKRLKKGDESQREAFKIYDVTDKTLKRFVEKGPEYVAKFWKRRWTRALKRAGFSIDWRRTFITTPMTPTYSRFIEWQYNTLKKRGYVVQGTHPVVWCPNCESPTGDHDRLDGVGESPIRYIIIKFELSSGEIIPCATLRPETIYGVTNIWIDPKIEYVKAKINGETWILSEESTKKIDDQLKDVEIVGKISGSEIIGKACTNPITGGHIPILPADFCDTGMGTGIVMSVPSHAPYDWIGLMDLKSSEEILDKYNIKKIVESVNPIKIIDVGGFEKHPAEEMCERFDIKNQKSTKKLEKATEELYKKEFHNGKCNEKCGKYSGMKISEAKDVIIEDLIDKNIGEELWETTGDVVCRCKSKCHIKILENQWFLKYSDKEWKAEVHDWIDKMTFHPEKSIQQFKNTVDWLKDKACTRKSGMGTKLPWDESWIIETLSDSTIYMAYYTLSRIIKKYDLKADDLTDEVFDYIFFGEGDVKDLSSDELKEEIIEKMREEFDYFYPVDLRTSGKDLVQNHLTFYIFHHLGIWNDSKYEKYYPRAMGVNGYVNVGGEKMSKSKGNFIPLKDLLNKYGADLTRMNIIASNENMDDADWREDTLPTYKSRIENLFQFVSRIKKAKRSDKKTIDVYLESILNKTIIESTDNYEKMKFRSAIQSSLFYLMNEVKWYIDRVGGIENCNKEIVEKSIQTIIKLIAPVTPHTSEELWKMMGNDSFISTSEWPTADKAKIDKNAIHLENIYKKTLDDIRQVKKLASSNKKSPKKLYLYFSTARELNYFEESKKHIEKTGFKDISLFMATDGERYDPQDKAARAKYGKPGIYLE